MPSTMVTMSTSSWVRSQWNIQPWARYLCVQKFCSTRKQVGWNFLKQYNQNEPYRMSSYFYKSFLTVACCFSVILKAIKYYLKEFWLITDEVNTHMSCRLCFLELRVSARMIMEDHPEFWKDTGLPSLRWFFFCVCVKGGNVQIPYQVSDKS